MRRPSEDLEKEKMTAWNLKYTRGQKVLVRPKKNPEYEAMAVTEAYMDCGMAVVFLDNGCTVHLDYVRAMKPCTYCNHLLAEPFPFETDEGEAVCQHCGEERNMQ